MSEAEGLGFAIALVVIVLVLLAYIGRAADNLPDPLDGTRAFVRHWDARLVSGKLSLVDQAKFTFELVDREATLEFGGPSEESAPSFTHLTIPLRGIPLRLELRPQWLHGGWNKLLGLEDIEIGELYFDNAFVIQGSNPAEVRAFLTQDVQHALLRLARCSQYGSFDLHLRISGGLLRITKHARLTAERDLTNLITCSLGLLGLIQQLDTGIEFTGLSTPQPASATECQVCGDPLQEKLVFCMKCKTPHHRDCWEYFGSCAVYGCGQKRYVDFKG